MIIEEVGADLVKEGRIQRVNKNTDEYSIFMMNLSISLLLTTLRYGPESDNDYGVTNVYSMNSLALSHIITSLEVYYQDIFLKLSKLILISEIDTEYLNKFLKKFKITIEYNDDDYVYKILPNNLNFQNKDLIKLFMKLIKLDTINNSYKEWEDTFSKNDDSTIQIRHNFIHGGIKFSREILNEEFIHDRIKCAIILVRNLEEQIDHQYPEIMNDSLFE